MELRCGPSVPACTRHTSSSTPRSNITQRCRPPSLANHLGSTSSDHPAHVGLRAHPCAPSQLRVYRCVNEYILNFWSSRQLSAITYHPSPPHTVDCTRQHNARIPSWVKGSLSTTQSHNTTSIPNPNPYNAPSLMGNPYPVGYLVLLPGPGLRPPRMWSAFRGASCIAAR